MLISKYTSQAFKHFIFNSLNSCSGQEMVSIMKSVEDLILMGDELPEEEEEEDNEAEGQEGEESGDDNDDDEEDDDEEEEDEDDEEYRRRTQ